ncbi:hypothetical protein KP509_1Z008400 [Ceratopteris richardii]|nr:hypothetical protein KP509_1Z008400 [Ceratopteris richardii]KAH6559440.1 hypothetical protein KP509_1Z008400 [Ceratopteris richardii]KAH6559443.1 hypothetical protein KP509_1Z008400 [Ceratopteris richardii]
MPTGGLSGPAKPHLSTKLNNIMTLTSTPTSSAVSDADSNEEIRSLDCNLAALCEHVQSEGWNAGAFSDIIVHAMGSTYCLHRLILSRSSVFRHMLQGPWKEAGASEVSLQIDDENVNGEAVAIALSYLYGHHPKLNDGNAFRVLAAASFLDLQDLCAICTEFIISEIWTDNFLAYQAFAESQDYGVYGERVRKACWGYLCRGGAVELKEILPKLSTQTLRTLLTSDELWVLSEEKRFELALSVLISRGTLLEVDGSQSADSITAFIGGDASSCYAIQSKDTFDCLHEDKTRSLEKAEDSGGKTEGSQVAHKVVLDLADAVADFCSESSHSSSLKKDQGNHFQQVSGAMYVYRSEKPGSPDKSQIEVDIGNICRPLMEIRKSMEASTCSSHSGQEIDYYGSVSCFTLRDQPQNCSSSQASSFPLVRCTSPNDWSREGASFPALTWGGRVVGRRRMKAYPNHRGWANNEDWDAFLSVFEGGGVLYCHMGFEELLHVRARLEELGFPCKAVSDGLWLQTLLKKHVLTIAAETCKTCCLFGSSCTCCKQSYNYSHCCVPSNAYREDQERNAGVIVASGFNADAHSVASVQGRVHVRGSVDGLAGIGRGSTFGPPGAAWSPSRFMFTRIPFTGFGNRPNQQNSANDQSDSRIDLSAMGMPGPAHSADGLPAAVRLSQGGTTMHSNQSGNFDDQFGKVVEESNRSMESAGHQQQNLETEHSWPQDWEANDPISLDLETPLRTFPPFRFGVEFENVHRLADGQSKHSAESFYAGSLWKISVQAFHDEDPQGRRTLGLFLHRRRAENIDAHRKVYLYTDNREKVTARYQLICPAKREVMIFGSLTQAGTLLPKSPKGWGWRTAFLFDELADLLQGSSLRVAAVVQLV